MYEEGLNLDCEKCGMPMKQVPAGVAGPRSKNPGKPYGSFWACDTRAGGCGATFSAKSATPSSIPQAPVDDKLLEGLRQIYKKVDIVEKKLDALIENKWDEQREDIKKNMEMPTP